MKKTIKKIINKTGFSIIRHKETPSILSFLKEFKIKTVIDAGANIGQFAHEVRLELPQAHIYSFEPMKNCYDTLVSAFADDALFTAYNLALGDTSTNAKIHKNEYTPSSSILENSKLLDEAFPFAKKSELENITVKTLDSVLSSQKLQKNILFKLDVQGYESKVLQGAEEILQNTKIVLIETSFYPLYEGQPLFDDIYEVLKKKGFRYHGNTGTKKHPQTGQPLFEDSIFIRE